MKITFTKIGDYYEAFGDDARLVARVLKLTLTRSRKGDDVMAGVPYHSIHRYADLLREAGHTVTLA